MLEKIDNGVIDFGVIVEPINKVNYDSISLNEDDTWGVLTTKTSELGHLEQISAKDLIAKPLIISRQQGVQRMIANMLDLDDADLSIIGKYNLLYNASLMVKEGVGHAICLEGIINTSETNLKFIPFEEQITSSLSLIWKKEKSLSTPAQLLLNKVRENLR
ncbi:hypothetical protein B5728_01960 [Mammaliicoccus sciuri]|nr:hypothetical protein B5728_01960 [Mammaliicoccus sciuri]